MNLIILFLLLLSIFFISFNLSKIYNTCPEPKVVYKYIHQTPYQQISNPIPLNKLFRHLFNDPAPWLGQYSSLHKKKKV